MNDFFHEVLGDVSDETRWLNNIFRTSDLVRLACTTMVCVWMLNILPKTGFFIGLEILIFLGMCVRVGLGIAKKPRDKYLRGGGVSFLELIQRKRFFRKNRKDSVYTIGAEKKYEYK